MLSNSALLDCKYLKSSEKAFDDISSSYIYSFINKKDHRFYVGSTLTLQVDFIIIFILELYLDKVYYKK
jgi:hypothetical protein